MPLYDYECADCGHFREFNTMANSAMPLPCPACETESRRVLSAPFVPLLKRNTRIAHERNELSANEPKVVSGRDLHKLGKPRGGTHGHDHCHGHVSNNSGLHYHRSSRPWMIGH